MLRDKVGALERRIEQAEWRLNTIESNYTYVLKKMEEIATSGSKFTEALLKELKLKCTKVPPQDATIKFDKVRGK